MTASSNLRIAEILDAETFVINHGSDTNIKLGQRFLVYNLGKEIFDPVTKESLGRLEIVRGTGRVTHVQQKISTVKSDMKAAPTRTIRRTIPPSLAMSLLKMGEMTEEEVLPASPQPFEGLSLDDKLRPIN